MNEEMIKRLKALAAEETLFEGDGGSNPYDASGGNYDDAYSLGVDDGEISLAREILMILKIPWK